MSRTAAPENRGPAQGRVTPPIDAQATVTLDGDAVTTLDVSAHSTLKIHVAGRDDGDALTDYDDESGEVPEPVENDDVPEQAQVEFPVSGSSWLTVTVDDERRTCVSAPPNAVARVHLAADGGDA